MLVDIEKECIRRERLLHMDVLRKHGVVQHRHGLGSCSGDNMHLDADLACCGQTRPVVLLRDLLDRDLCAAHHAWPSFLVHVAARLRLLGVPPSVR